MRNWSSGMNASVFERGAARGVLRLQIHGLEAGARERLLAVLRRGPAHVPFHVGESRAAGAALLVPARRAPFEVAERDRADLRQLRASRARCR